MSRLGNPYTPSRADLRTQFYLIYQGKTEIRSQRFYAVYTCRLFAAIILGNSCVPLTLLLTKNSSTFFGVCDMFLHRHVERLDKFGRCSLYTLRSSFRQLIECHSPVVFKLVLDIFTATGNFIFQITVILSAYPHHYSQAFCF